MAEIPQAAINWIASGDTGMSSQAIWAHMSGSQMRDGYGFSHPHDPSDLARCLRLLLRVPIWRLRIDEMAQHGSAWATLVEHWEELENLLAQEIGPRWEEGRGKSAPKTYARMRELLDALDG